MCLIDLHNSHIVPLTQSNPLDKVVEATNACFCTGKGHDGLCACERKRVPFGAVKAMPSSWKPRIRVKAISKHW